MNQFPSQNYAASTKQHDQAPNTSKSTLPFNPSNLGSFTNNSFPPAFPNLASNPLANTFASAGISSEHMGYPYMQVISLIISTQIYVYA